MCLKLQWWNRRTHTAKKDIVVYKVVVGGDNSLKTAYRFEHIKIDAMYLSSLNRYGDRVFQGLHSLKSFKRAKQLSDQQWRGHVIKCIIPKYSMYYKGVWDNSPYFKRATGYASDTLKYVKDITTNGYSIIF